MKNRNKPEIKRILGLAIKYSMGGRKPKRRDIKSNELTRNIPTPPIQSLTFREEHRSLNG